MGLRFLDIDDEDDDDVDGEGEIDINDPNTIGQVDATPYGPREELGRAKEPQTEEEDGTDDQNDEDGLAIEDASGANKQVESTRKDGVVTAKDVPAVSEQNGVVTPSVEDKGTCLPIIILYLYSLDATFIQ